MHFSFFLSLQNVFHLNTIDDNNCTTVNIFRRQEIKLISILLLLLQMNNLLVFFQHGIM